MNIGIIVYSRTGQTLSVANKLVEKLSADGHAATLARLKAIGPSHPGVKDVRLEALPDPAAYDALVFGAPAEGGVPAAPMTSYLSQIASLQNKPVALLVAQGFPFPSWGGNQTVAQMKSMCESKGANMLGSGIVNRMNLRRGRQIAKVVDHLSSLFQAR